MLAVRFSISARSHFLFTIALRAPALLDEMDFALVYPSLPASACRLGVLGRTNARSALEDGHNPRPHVLITSNRFALRQV